MKKILFMLMLVSCIEARWTNFAVLNDTTISACDSVGSGRWTQYGANGTVTEDAEGIRLTTLSNASYTAMQLTTTFHKSHHNWYRIKVRFDSTNIATTNGLSVQFFSDGATANGTAIDLNNAVRNNYANGIVEYAWCISNMSTWSGTPTDSVARVVVRVYPTNGHIVNCWVSGIYGYNQPESDSVALVSFGWDDYFASQYDTIYKLMAARGWKGSLFGSKAGVAGSHMTQAQIDTLINQGWSLHTHIYDHSLDYGQRTLQSAANQLDSSIADIRSNYLRVTGKENLTWQIGAYPANAPGYYNDNIISLLQSRNIKFFSTTDPSPRQHEPRYRPYSFSNFMDYNTVTQSYLRAQLDSAVKYKSKLLLRGHDAVPTITQSYQIRIDSLTQIMDTIKARETAGQLRVVTYDKFFVQTMPTPPIIIYESIDTLKLSVHSTNADSYQWYQNDTAISGATDSILVLDADSAFYATRKRVYCTITNGAGSAKIGYWYFNKNGNNRIINRKKN